MQDSSRGSPTVWHMVRVRVPLALEEEAAARMHAAGFRGAWSRPAGKGTVTLEAAYESESAAGTGAGRVERFLREEGADPTLEMGLAADEPWVERVEAGRAPLDLPGGFRVLPRTGSGAAGVPDERVLVIPATRAFGTGEHATTRLTCAGLVRELRPGYSVLDLGTGSGILAFVAARLGAAPVLGIDLDPEAVVVARSNRRDNHLDGHVHLAAGSALSVSPGFDIVLANIERSALVAAAGEVAYLQPSGGTVVLSGLLREDARVVGDAFGERGYVARHAAEEGDWCALTLAREGRP